MLTDKWQLAGWNLVDAPRELPKIFPDNILVWWFGERVYDLGMTLFFGLYFPVGTITVYRIYLLLIGFNSRK
jgi:hypothetical protein